MLLTKSIKRNFAFSELISGSLDLKFSEKLKTEEEEGEEDEEEEEEEEEEGEEEQRLEGRESTLG